MKRSLELSTVLKELHEVSGFRISVHDTAFREIASYPESVSGFCGLVQQDPRAMELCHAADYRAFSRAQEEDDLTIYRCPFGLYEAAAPLYHFGVLAGYLMMGQTLDSAESSRSHTEQAAQPYVKDEAALREAVKNIPASTREKIRSCFSIMMICSEYITLTNRLNLTDRRLGPAVKQYIGEHYGRRLTIDELCSQFFCSKSTLLHTFKSTAGTTVNKYLNGVRLEHAEKLLRETSRPIGEISAACGFSDQNYFSKVFQKKHGVSPSAWRAEPRKAK